MILKWPDYFNWFRILNRMIMMWKRFFGDFYGCNLDSRQMVVESSFTINQIIVKDYDLCPRQNIILKGECSHFLFLLYCTHLFRKLCWSSLYYKGVLLLPWFPTVATSMVVLEPLVETSDFLRTLAFLWCAELAVDKLGLGYGFRCLFVAMASRISSIRDLNA